MSVAVSLIPVVLFTFFILFVFVILVVYLAFYRRPGNRPNQKENRQNETSSHEDDAAL